jgi:hypothetical protein
LKGPGRLGRNYSVVGRVPIVNAWLRPETVCAVPANFGYNLASEVPMSKRTEMQRKRQRQNRFQAIFLIALAVIALGAVGYLLYQGLQSGPLAGSQVAVDPGKTKGPADAKVVIQEFSDFQ